MQISRDTVVSIHYTLTDDSGTVIDSSAGAEPLVYLQGAGNIIPGLENALVGKVAGDELTVRVSPEEGYGPSMADLVQQVPLAMFQGVDVIEPGMMFQAQDGSGQIQQVHVVAVESDLVTVDSNHPLAGQFLNFEVKIVEVRPASTEEITHGHAHGPGGHHH